jgi:hypothetical protein
MYYAASRGAAFFAAAFLRADFAFFVADFAFAAARFAAHIFLVAAMIAALPAALSLRFGFNTCTGDGDSASARSFAHLAFCATAIFRPAAAPNFLRFRTDASGVVEVYAEPVSIARSSAI